MFYDCYIIHCLFSLNYFTYIVKYILYPIFYEILLYSWNLCLIVYSTIFFPMNLVKKYIINGRLNEMRFLHALSIKRACVRLSHTTWKFKLSKYCILSFLSIVSLLQVSCTQVSGKENTVSTVTFWGHIKSTVHVLITMVSFLPSLRTTRECLEFLFGLRIWFWLFHWLLLVNRQWGCWHCQCCWLPLH